jgi:hypothetical protein
MATDKFIVVLNDVTPNRATVVSVRKHVRATFPGVEIPERNYAFVDSDEIPNIGERVWIASGWASGGERVITGRA